jgi:hypothetical protein
MLILITSPCYCSVRLVSFEFRCELEWLIRRVVFVRLRHCRVVDRHRRLLRARTRSHQRAARRTGRGRAERGWKAIRNGWMGSSVRRDGIRRDRMYRCSMTSTCMMLMLTSCVCCASSLFVLQCSSVRLFHPPAVGDSARAHRDRPMCRHAHALLLRHLLPAILRFGLLGQRSEGWKDRGVPTLCRCGSDASEATGCRLVCQRSSAASAALRATTRISRDAATTAAPISMSRARSHHPNPASVKAQLQQQLRANQIAALKD